MIHDPRLLQAYLQNRIVLQNFFIKKYSLIAS
jgi:hypothetical protein